MDRIKIIGGRPLQGRIRIGGAKNAALPLMTATLLTDETLTLSNLPHLQDIATLLHLLQQHGTEVSLQDNGDDGHEGRSVSLTTPHILSTTAPYDLVRKMRASVLVLGPLLAREGRARVSLPGGCAIGPRPVNLHIEGLETLGARIEIDNGYIVAEAPNGLKGGEVHFPQVSVGATENILMAACLAEGTTVIRNAAREPEISDLGACLMAMGARIEGLGSETITVTGVPRLHGAAHTILPDRIETGTYAMAAAITGGDILLTHTDPSLLTATLDAMRSAGCEITENEHERTIRIRRQNGPLQGTDVMTQVYPGYPTDMQAQFMALMSIAEGASMITESIFENRFMHVPELARMGANITVHGASALVRGVSTLTGAPVMATDLRASVSLVLAGLAAKGETVVNRVYHLDRGYERLEEKLAACGAQICRLPN